MRFLLIVLTLYLFSVINILLIPINPQMFLLLLFFDQLVYRRPNLHAVEIGVISIYADLISGSFCGATLIGLMALTVAVNVLSAILYDAGFVVVYVLFLIVLACIMPVLHYLQQLFLVSATELIASRTVSEFLVTMLLYPATYILLFSRKEPLRYAQKA
ncbi:MAG: hypothetical protein LBJ03_01715 [Holosporales bacterium]|jgi:hypothetical protein|nr:hypothetical protein [Holosporales bacterium]